MNSCIVDLNHFIQCFVDVGNYKQLPWESDSKHILDSEGVDCSFVSASWNCASVLSNFEVKCTEYLVTSTTVQCDWISWDITRRLYLPKSDIFLSNWYKRSAVSFRSKPYTSDIEVTKLSWKLSACFLSDHLLQIEDHEEISFGVVFTRHKKLLIIQINA